MTAILECKECGHHAVYEQYHKERTAWDQHSIDYAWVLLEALDTVSGRQI